MERINLFIRLIDAFPKGHPLKRYRGDVYFEIRNFYLLFSTMERNGWTSGLINRQIDAYLSQLEPAQAAMETGWTEKLRAAVHEFDNYQLLLHELNRSDRPGSSGPAIPNHPLVEQFTLLLHYLATEQDILYSGDAMLFEGLHGPWFNIPPIELARLAIELADLRNETSLRKLLQEKVNTPPRDLFTSPVHEGLQKASKAIEQLTGMATQTPLSSLIDHIRRETGMEEYINNDPGQAAVITNFTNYIKEEALINPALDLQLLVKLLTLLQHTTPAIQPAPVYREEHIIAALSPLYQPANTTNAIYPKEPEWVLPGRPEISRLEKVLEDKLVQRFALHVTALNSFLRCPLEFYFQSLLRIPSPRNEATEFGSAVHHALELLFRKMQTGDDAFPAKELLISDFETYMHLHRKSFTPEQFNRRLQYGREVLNNYYDEYVHRWHMIVAVERNIRHVTVDGVPVKGEIDKLEFDGRSVTVVDYKTGDPEKSKARLQPPGETLPNGGDYWRQAVFYKILVDNYPQKEWKVTSVEFDFIEPDKKGHYHKERLFITPAAVTTVTQQIVTVWQRIQQRDFYTGCGRSACHWCHFVKSYGLAVALHE